MTTTTRAFLCVQGSEEWRMIRAGKVTASAIADVLAKGKTKGSESTIRNNYRAKLIAEILTGRPSEDEYVSHSMRWGIETEPLARTAYELAQDVTIELAGFVPHPRIECCGASPDALIGEDGLAQFKCPNTATHLNYLLKGEVPSEYKDQMLVEMACTGRLWCDLVSFDPRLPREFQLFIRRFPRDEARIAEIEGKVEEFLEEIRDMLVRLSSLGNLEILLRKSLALAQTQKALAQAQKGPQLVVASLGAAPDTYGAD
jgi:hypothetical protein